MSEYELLCHREKQLLLNASMNNNNTNKNLNITAINNFSHNNDNRVSSNSATMPRAKKCEVKPSKSLPVSQSNSIDCILGETIVEDSSRATRSLAEDRDFVTKL